MSMLKEIYEKHKPNPKIKAVRLYGKAKQKFRVGVAKIANEFCKCGTYAPANLENGSFDVFRCGHLSHIKSYGAGGGDALDNVEWKCYNCHMLGEDGHLAWKSDKKEREL
ncbi:MAG: hypothetical protein HQ580_19240 [Planctomycetes bacterium]|nr:hypothetical protein [Planctomycetota bacterium]